MLSSDWCRGRLYAVGGMGVGDDLSSVEVFSPWSGAWTSLDRDMREVNGWCSACLGESSMYLSCNLLRANEYSWKY